MCAIRGIWQGTWISVFACAACCAYAASIEQCVSKEYVISLYFCMQACGSIEALALDGYDNLCPAHLLTMSELRLLDLGAGSIDDDSLSCVDIVFLS